MRELDCLKCGNQYVGTERSRYCPDCRKEIKRAWAVEHGLCYMGAKARWGEKKNEMQ